MDHADDGIQKDRDGDVEMELDLPLDTSDTTNQIDLKAALSDLETAQPLINADPLLLAPSISEPPNEQPYESSSLGVTTTSVENGSDDSLWMTEDCVKFVFDDTCAYGLLECRLCE
jgi:hypothetical protein